MDLTNLAPWKHDAADLRREDRKREASPSSFFHSQGRAIVLAAQYFTDDRLKPAARGGVALKHRHRIHLALFGQLMASLEYLLKDFIARVIDRVPTFDDRIRDAKWITIDAERVLSVRTAPTSPGALLFHTTLGWHDPEEVNKRYSHMFQAAPIETAEIQTLKALWVLRHAVAHNAGFVPGADAARTFLPALSAQVADITAGHIEDAYKFLCPIARRTAERVGDRILITWLKTRVPAGPDYKRDKDPYQPLKLLATCVESRTVSLPTVTKAMYKEDWKRAESEMSGGG